MQYLYKSYIADMLSPANFPKDIHVQAVKTVILNGLPDNRKNCQSKSSHTHSYSDELTLHDALIFKGEKVVTSQSMSMRKKNSERTGSYLSPKS